MQFATERQRTTGILPKQYVCHFELVIVTFHAASMTGQWMYSSKRQCETGGGDRSNPIVGTVARLAAVIDWASSTCCKAGPGPRPGRPGLVTKVVLVAKLGLHQEQEDLAWSPK